MQYAQLLKETKTNENFRKVLFTNSHSQLVLMSLLPGEEIGMETHEGIDQILYFVEGSGKAVVGGAEQQFKAGDVVCVPAGTEHNFINTGENQLKLFTVYSPPEHKDGTVHKTKADALADEDDHA